MEALRLRAHIGQDGMLNLSVPVGINNVDCDVIISVQPSMTQTEWLQFIDETFGSILDESFTRLPQGEFDRRETIE